MAPASCLYRHPAGVTNPAGTSLLTTPEGGAVAVDGALLALWDAADGRIATDLGAHASNGVLAETLACLAEAGLLQRNPAAPVSPAAAPTIHQAPDVSAVVVVSSEAELAWLDECLPSLVRQDYPLHEIVLVDNGGVVPGTPTTPRGDVAVRVCRRARCGTYAAALNDGVAGARGAFLLLMNADVRLHPSALGHMLARAIGDERCAAVAPKLRFWRTPAFLNGIGNRIPAYGWGTDNAIGQLDLGQFDDWSEVPSGCLTMLLVRASAFADVGRFDAGYPAYYEDADWTYRARALGYSIGAAPAAEAVHVFGASWNEPGAESLSLAKQARAGAGRLRFAWKIPSRRAQSAMVSGYLLEDLVNVRACLRARRRRLAASLMHGIALFAVGLPGAIPLRWDVQRRRRVPDDALFVPEADMPRSCLDGGKPLLTTTLIRDYYAPLMRSGRTRPLPEMR